ncbi:MAG: FtsK/SpoIIIE domain-containing protein [Eubacteriales bacterium]
MPKEENVLAEAIQSMRYLWRHRKGQEIPAAVLDVFDNLGFVTKDQRRPVMLAKKRTAYGWHLIFRLPPGISYQSIRNRREYFQDACNAWIVFEWDGRLHMDIQAGRLPDSVLYEWDYREYRSMALPVPIGVTQRGVEVLDLVEAPHLLVAGVTKYGKSNFLNVLINSLLPLARIAIVDLKRLEFSYLEGHCLLAETQRDALALMRRLNAEMERRIDILKKARVVKVQHYKGDMPYIVLVVDELAEIQEEETFHLLDRLVRLARAVGISVVAATQRPSVSVIKGDTRFNFPARLCYLAADEGSSRMILGEQCSLAAYLPAIPGRAIYKFGVTEKEVQTMYLPKEQAEKMLPESKGSWYCEPAPKGLLPR